MFKSVNELTAGDRICEADGFMWQVDSIVKETKLFRDVNVSPVYQTMLSERPQVIRLSRRRSVRVAEQAAER